MVNLDTTKILVSIIVPTYNRAYTLDRCIKSILVQTHKNFEIIIVNDGSIDDTESVINNFEDTRIKVLCHNDNQGVCAAINTGFNSITGEWFTIIGSDDELVENAIETMLDVLSEVSPDITAVTCNCMDTTTGKFSGKGLDADQYLNAEDIIRRCSGEHWGLTKTSLLQGNCLNKKLRGAEAVLWYRISKRAKRYYIHKALRIYHTEGDDRICAIRSIDLISMAIHHKELSVEVDYIEGLKKFDHESYRKHIFFLGIYHIHLKQLKLAKRDLLFLIKSFDIKHSLALLSSSLLGIKTTGRILNSIRKS